MGFWSLICDICEDGGLFRIESISGNVTADEEDSVEFQCVVDANPLSKKNIRWDLPDHPDSEEPGRDWRDRSQVEFDAERKTSTLRLRGITRSDAGRVICIASNGVKDSFRTATSHLIVNRKIHFLINITSLYQVLFCVNTFGNGKIRVNGPIFRINGTIFRINGTFSECAEQFSK